MSNEIARREIDGVLAEMPSDLRDAKPEGLDHLTAADIAMPRLLIAQQMSPQLDPSKPQFLEDLRVGEMFNSLTGQIYGKGPLLFGVVRADMPRWVEFIPKEQGGGIKDPNVPFGDPRTAFQGTKPPAATKFYDFIVILLPVKEFIAISFKSTGLKVARQLNGLMQARQKPIYTGAYQLLSVPTQNAKGSFFIPQVKNAGWLDTPTRLITKEAYDNLKTKTIDIDMPEARGADAHTDNGDTSFDPAELERQANQAGM